MSGQFAEATEAVNRALALTEPGARGPSLGTDRLLFAHTESLLYAGRPADASAIAEAQYGAATLHGPSVTGGPWLALLAQGKTLAGDIASARSLLAQSLGCLGVHDPMGLRSRMQAASAIAAAQAGDIAAAEEVLSGIDDAHVHADYRAEILTCRARSWLLAAKGETGSAARESLEIARRALDRHHFAMAVVALHDAVRFGHPELVAGELDELASGFEGALSPAFARHAAALRDADGPVLDSVSEGYAALGANLLAAEAAAQAASAHRQSGDDRAGNRSRARCALLVARCPGADTPALRHRAPLLTKRQDQIARLACHRSSEEIADHLAISVRTVESHLDAVYLRLGVHSRVELAEVLDVRLADPLR